MGTWRSGQRSSKSATLIHHYWQLRLSTLAWEPGSADISSDHFWSFLRAISVYLNAGHVNSFLLAFILIITIITIIIIPLIENTEENSMKDPRMYSQALVTEGV